MKRTDPESSGWQKIRSRIAAFFLPKDRELPSRTMPAEKKPLHSSKNKGRLILRELLLLLLFSVILLFFEYSDRLFGAAYPYVAMTVWLLYAGTIILLFFLVVIFNRGIDSEIPAMEDLLPTMTLEEKERYIERCRVGKARAKKILHFLIPIAGAFLIDLAYLYFV